MTQDTRFELTTGYFCNHCAKMHDDGLASIHHIRITDGRMFYIVLCPTCAGEFLEYMKGQGQQPTFASLPMPVAREAA